MQAEWGICATIANEMSLRSGSFASAQWPVGASGGGDVTAWTYEQATDRWAIDRGLYTRPLAA